MAASRQWPSGGSVWEDIVNRLRAREAAKDVAYYYDLTVGEVEAILTAAALGHVAAAWTDTTTVGPSGWRMTWWLPLILATENPARSSALTTFAPGTAGMASGIRQRRGSASAHPDDRPRRSRLPAHSAGQPPPHRASDHRQPHQYPGGSEQTRTRHRPHPARRRKAHEQRGSQHRFSHIARTTARRRTCY